MVNVELPVRWSEEIENEDGSVTSSHSYGRIVINLKDIRNYNIMDENHTIVRTYQNDSYCINLPFETFKDLVSNFTGMTIHVINVVINEEKPKRRKKNDDDMLM